MPTVTIHRTTMTVDGTEESLEQDITVHIPDLDTLNIREAIDEDGNPVELTREEVQAAQRMVRAGHDEEGK